MRSICINNARIARIWGLWVAFVMLGNTSAKEIYAMLFKLGVEAEVA